MWISLVVLSRLGRGLLRLLVVVNRQFLQRLQHLLHLLLSQLVLFLDLAHLLRQVLVILPCGRDKLLLLQHLLLQLLHQAALFLNLVIFLIQPLVHSLPLLLQLVPLLQRYLTGAEV